MSALKIVLLVLATLLSPGLHARDLVVGQVAPLDPAQTGFQLKKGIELCFDAVNAAGGVNGNTLRLVAKDRATAAPQSSKEAVDKTRELLEESSPIALIG